MRKKAIPKIVIILFLLIPLLNTIHAQQQIAEGLLQQANSLQDNVEYDQAEKLYKQLPGRFPEQLVFQVLYPFAQVLKDGKALVDDDVEQGIEQIIGATSAHSGAAAAQPFAYRLEGVLLAVEETDDVVVAAE